MGSVRSGTVAGGTPAEIEALASQLGQSIRVEPIDLPQAAVEVRRPEPSRWLRSLPLPLLPFLIFCILLGLVAVTSNFGGIPLSFAFIALLGTNGFITLLLREWLDLRLYPGRFSLYSWTGLTMVYFYFQLPLMVLIFTPAIARLKPDWREAAAT